MKKPFIFVLLLSFSLVIVSVVGSLIFYDDNPSSAVVKKKVTKEITYEKIDKDSPIINVYNVSKNKIEKIDIEEYLYGVLSSEMPSTFDEEALKAQAIAARTYVIYKMENNITSGHKNSAVCTNSAHCQAYTSYDDLKKIKGEDWIKSDYVKVKKAVDDTKGQIVSYEEKAILPLYFSTSSGKTENSKDVFSTQYPYLVSVDSPYEENSPKYSTTYSIKKSKFIKYIKNIYPQINISLDKLDKEVSIVDRTDGGCVKIIEVGNVKISGTDMRKILNLNSANFTINYNNDEMNFTVKGYGHGVGMSQWGADGMAKKGYKYYDILFHYFKGTDIKDMY
ncbi:MAG: stage II sporulation protein D [Terrisporobacter othiniensis]|uniref:stage II sporulation protein D n=1 Tax=Terrisporobacter othiniensis TaxID=1577792 RepID=UPI00290C8E35|nr:stage II sporulation protein D [Terrisporobacter othiniensis]MDU6985695.1 stage II sporulation protein D [Terrisporobacter othiniensis]